MFYHIGNQYRNIDLLKSLDYYRKGLNLSLEKNYSKGIAEGWHSLGVYHYYTSSFDSCRYYWEKALEIREQQKDMDGEARALNNLGVICRLTGDYPCAIANYERIISKLSKQGDKVLLSNAYNNLGLVYETVGEYPEALKYFHQSLRIDQEIKDDEGVAYTLNNIGLIHSHLNNYVEAKANFSTAYQLFRKSEDKVGMAMAVNNLGEVYTDLKEYAIAIDYFNRSLELETEIGNTNGMAFSYQSIGKVHKARGELQRAKQYFEKALAFQNDDDRELLAKILLNLGTINTELQLKNEAAKFCRQAYLLSKEYLLQLSLKAACKCLYALENEKGNKAKAFDYLLEYTLLNDSVFNKDNTRKLTQMEMQFEFSKQQLQDSLEQAKKDLIVQEELKRQEIQLKAQRQFAIGLSVGFVLVLLLAIVIYRGYKNKQKANEEISRAYSIIEEKNRNITDSIEYAKYIQDSVIPDKTEVIKAFKEAFVLFIPRDIVSGDFYWYFENEEYQMISAADCTGHGVPGALLAMLCSNIMNTAVSERKLFTPGEILTFTNKALQQSVKRKDSITQANDGMDLALCVIEKQTKKISLATANNPLLLIKNGTIDTYKGENVPIGGNSPVDYEFQTLEVPYFENATYYLLSDGYIDQFGGEKGKKYLSKRLKEKLLELQSLPLQYQQQKLVENFHAWKGNHDQIDDVTLIGFKV